MATPKQWMIITAFAALYVIWGSTYLAILFAIETIPPLLMAGVRFLVAGTILYLVARLTRASRPRPEHWRTALVVGACLLLGGNGGVTLSEQYVSSGLAALLVATVPIYIALLSWLFGMSARPSPFALAGLAGGFLGVGLLVGPAIGSDSGGRGHHAWIGMIILLCSSLIWSAGSLYSRRARNHSSPFLAAGQQMLCGGALLVLVASVTGEWSRFDPTAVTSKSIVAFVYLVLIGGIVGYVSYAWLLRYCEPSKVATYAYVNPVVAVLLGAAFAGERLTLRTAGAAALIIGSVALVITAQQFQGRSALPPAVAQPECENA